ncbi:MAG TPA: hypothetical protein VN786_12110 [Acidimicrobiales bacterium]|nr:hypothetical protein [Acidimicrobiales bacterium]
MSPDKKPQRERRRSPSPRPLKTAPAATDAYDIAYFKRHVDDDPTEAMPGRDFLDSCPVPVRAKFVAVLIAVAAAPPQRFSGGGFWEAMHDEMTGYHEVRIDGPRRHHYRLFCKLDTEARDRGPLLVVLCGASKPFRTEFPDAVYGRALAMGGEYLARNPRSLA